MISLKELEIACYLYNRFTNYDENYLKLSKQKIIDLDNKQKVILLIKWLRSWGCRQFKNECENISIKSLQNWYQKNKDLLPNFDVHLTDYNFDNSQNIITCFNLLMDKIASFRNFKNKMIKVKIGSVGAAKILFALRPNLFAPWDAPIYKVKGLQPNGYGYIEYLKEIKSILVKLKTECRKKGIGWTDLFDILDKKHTSYPKLIDEYFWVNITNKCKTFEIIKKIKNSS